MFPEITVTELSEKLKSDDEFSRMSPSGAKMQAPDVSVRP
jgi:hypothetical protein